MQEKIKNKIKSLPDSPGVYFFLGRRSFSGGGSLNGRKILYIGKATSLRDRVRSYFSGNIEAARGPLISKMISEFTDIAYQKTDSVLEALVLEANLIKKYKPEANIWGKDDKSFSYVVITKEDFPRVLVMRGRELEKENNSPPLAALGPSLKLREGEGRVRPWKTFGPFTNGSQLREAMKIVRRLFPFRGNKCEPGQGRACFERQIGLCPGVCTGEISKEDYKKQIKNIVLFFEGNKKKLVREIKREMREFAKKQEFEKAEKLKRQLYAIYHIQDVSLIKSDPAIHLSRTRLDSSKELNLSHSHMSRTGLDIYSFRIEGYDIAHTSGTNTVGVMTVVEDGEAKKSDYRKFSGRQGWAFGGKTVLGDKGPNDPKALYEIISRRLNHPEWPFPDLVVVDGGIAQKRSAEKALRENGLDIPVVAVVKDERHRPREILGINEPRTADNKLRKYEKEILMANSESHRFAIKYHKHLRGKIK